MIAPGVQTNAPSVPRRTWVPRWYLRAILKFALCPNSNEKKQPDSIRFGSLFLNRGFPLLIQHVRMAYDGMLMGKVRVPEGLRRKLVGQRVLYCELFGGRLESRKSSQNRITPSLDRVFCGKLFPRRQYRPEVVDGYVSLQTVRIQCTALLQGPLTFAVWVRPQRGSCSNHGCSVFRSANHFA